LGSLDRVVSMETRKRGIKAISELIQGNPTAACTESCFLGKSTLAIWVRLYGIHSLE
jgi:hypothetical protein